MRSGERYARADALDAAMKATGMKAEDIAVLCSVDEKTVRCWRLGLRPLFDESVEEMGDFGAVVWRAMAEQWRRA